MVVGLEGASPTEMPQLSATDAAAVASFRELVRIESTVGEGAVTGEYSRAAEWFATRCKSLGLDVTEVSPVEGKPMIIATLHGAEPDLPSILLNSHYDVVPCFRDQWCCEPFDADIREGYTLAQGSPDAAYAGKGGPCVYGRGTQDMKCVPVQYLEAIRHLQAAGGPEWQPRRTLHVTFVPDEEVGGADGWGRLVTLPEWEALQPIALALDEGLANPREAVTVFYGERTVWWLLIRAEGPTGHGSRFIQSTAVEKLMGVVNKALAFRKEQEVSLGWDCEHGCKHSQAKKLGDVTTLNVTMLKGGVSVDGGKTYSLNVIPTEMEAGFDVRISPNLATAEFRAKLDEWCSEEGLSWKFAPWAASLEDHYVTAADRSVNPFFGILEDACTSLGLRVEREIFPAGTDSQLLRSLGVQALGISPMPCTPVLLHEHNEALSVETFLRGIRIYVSILGALLGAPRQPCEAKRSAEVSRRGSGEPPAKRTRA